MSTVDVSGWAKLNIWRQPDGELCVRPGLRRLFTPDGGTDLLAAFSVRNDFDDEVWHYFAVKDTSDGSIHLVIRDENYDTFQDFLWASDGNPRVVTAAVVEGLGLITSPDLPTLFFVVGSGVEFAAAVQPSPPNGTTAIDVPRGICCAFCNRIVIANGRSMWFSDPVADDGGDPRTFIAENQNQRAGIVYGLHEGAGGMLVAVTTEGTYGLDADASAVQVVGSNGTAWRLLSHTSAHSHRSSCTHRGRIYALTRDGFAAVDTETTDEVFISDPTVPRAFGPRVSAEDWRRASMFVLDEGPCVAAPFATAFFRSDMTHDIASWWRDQTENPGDVVGTLRDHDGTDLLAFPDGVYRVIGDFDGEAGDAAPVLPSPIGVIFGTAPGVAAENRLVRRINVAAAVDGAETLGASVRGSDHSATVDADPFGMVIGVTAFGAAGKRYVTTPIANAEIDFGDLVDSAPTRDVGIELATSGCLARISTGPDVEYSGSAPKRPQAKG